MTVEYAQRNNTAKTQWRLVWAVLGTMALLYHDEVVSGGVFWIPALTAVKCTQQKQQYEFHTKKRTVWISYQNGMTITPAGSMIFIH